MNDLKSKILNEYEDLCGKMHGRMLCSCNRQRKNAIRAFESVGFPTKKIEDWKYTPLKFLEEYDFEIAKKNEVVEVPEKIRNKILSYSSRYNTITLVNGFYRADLSFVEHQDKIDIIGLADGLARTPNLVENCIAKDVDYDRYVFTAINHAISRDGVFVKIHCNTRMNKPLALINLIVAKDKPVMSVPRNVFSIRNNSIAKLIQIDIHIGKYAGFSNLMNDIELKDYAYLDYLHLQHFENDKLFNISNTSVEAGKRASYNKNTISINGKFIRNNDNVNINDEGVDVNMNGLFFADKENMIDNHTFITHDASNCNTNENYKGIIDDKATGIFNGMILVKPDAQQTNAFQSNHNILLSDDATINTKPELEIYADDVKCSHGATSGSIDPEQIFYLKARGISEETAKSLLIAGFTEEIIDKIGNKELRNDLKRDVYNKLEIDLDVI